MVVIDITIKKATLVTFYWSTFLHQAIPDV
jgi:hypothetical protein